MRLCCEPQRGLAEITAESFDGSRLYFATHPLATVAMMEIFERRHLFSLHAACLCSVEGRGVLVSGPSGSGKSTLTLALARAGLGFLSDDVVFLATVPGTAERRVRVLGFADTLGLTPYAAERFSDLRSHVGAAPQPGFPKPLGRIEDLFGAAAIPACDPVAIVFPEIDREHPSRIAEIDAGEALLRLVPDVLLTDEESTRRHLEAIGTLLGQVRCYRLRSGPDLERATEFVAELVR